MEISYSADIIGAGGIAGLGIPGLHEEAPLWDITISSW